MPSRPLLSSPPNKSFKPTPCRGIGYVLYATLARIRRPATGRLNSGVSCYEKSSLVLNQLLPIVAMPIFLLLASRQRNMIFAWLASALVLALLLLFLLEPSVTTYYRNPKWAYGYESWVFPLNAAILTAVLAVWRSYKKPGIISLFICSPISFSVLFLGAWVA